MSDTFTTFIPTQSLQTQTTSASQGEIQKHQKSWRIVHQHHYQQASVVLPSLANKINNPKTVQQQTTKE